MKLIFWGTGDTGKPRTRILLAALEEVGVDVVWQHRDIWSGVEDKSQLGTADRIGRYLRWIGAYPVLLTRLALGARPDAIFLTYPAQLDVLVARPIARLRRIPIVMDLFISIYDTAVIDRQMARPGSLKAKAIKALEWLACRAADRVLIDTAAHARYVEELFGLETGSVGSVPVGAEPSDFPKLPERTPGARPRVLFYGQLIPLHGIATVLDAALSERGEGIDWVLIGSGQETPLLEDRLGSTPPPHATWKRWVPYSELTAEIAAADVCLGIFGTSRKSASVVPNKVYQCLASGRHVVTRQSPALQELVQAEKEPGLTPVAPGDATALLDGIDAAIARGAPPASPALIERFSRAAIGQRLLDEIGATRN